MYFCRLHLGRCPEQSGTGLCGMKRPLETGKRFLEI
ncbi:MAG: hypothetical protein K0R57_140 [Paenibacillaceae bacterium]|jgi:hypothetical protein|nr:hypothetical protein [Paenibacillaceae bacterium]